MLQQLQQAFIAAHGSAVGAMHQAQAELYAIVQQQAAVLSYHRRVLAGRRRAGRDDPAGAAAEKAGFRRHRPAGALMANAFQEDVGGAARGAKHNILKKGATPVWPRSREWPESA